MPLCAQVDGRVLRTGTDSLAVFVVRGRDTIRTGTIVDELAVVQGGATSHLRRVEAEFTGTPVTFWVDKTTRRLVKQEMRVRPGMIILFTRTGIPATRRAA